MNEPSTPVTVTLTRDDLFGILGACARDAAFQQKRLDHLTDGSDAHRTARWFYRSSESCRAQVEEILFPRKGWSA